MSDELVSEEAVTAAAEAMEDAAMRWIGRDLGTIHRNDIARDALLAAAPLIESAVRAKISAALTDEMLAANTRYIGTTEAALGYIDGLAAAARVALGDQEGQK